jgi:multidrug efflux pump subunit AcrA (membrane-fusion protein)
MSWIPGWNSIAGTAFWSGFFFWASIASLILLGVTEVLSHRYTERHDELAAIEQTDTQRRHDEEMARIHLETKRLTAEAEASRAQIADAQAGAEKARAEIANAQAVAASANERAFRLQRELMELKAPRQMSPHAMAKFVQALRPFRGQEIEIATYLNSPECASVVDQIRAITFGWKHIAPERPIVMPPGQVGVLVYTNPSAPESVKLAAETLANGLSGYGLMASTSDADDHPPPPMRIRVTVGAKM